MKRAGIGLSLIMTVVFSGCSLLNTSTDEAEEKVESNIPTIIQKEEVKKEILEAPKNYRVGERVVVRDEYAVTLIGVTETEASESYSTEGNQPLLIELLYENLSMGKDHPIYEMEYSQSNGYEFSINDGLMMVPDTKNPYRRQELNFPYTPVGTKSLQKYVYNRIEEDNTAKISFHDYKGEHTNFIVSVGDKAFPNLEGSLPKIEDSFKQGEIILFKGQKEYSMRLDSVKQIDFPDEDYYAELGAFYQVEITFSNMNNEEIQYNNLIPIIIDEQGNTGYGPYSYFIDDQEEEQSEDGIKVYLTYATLMESENLLFYCVNDEWYKDIADGVYIEVNQIDE